MLIKSFLLALQFLTRVPVRVNGPVSARDLARSMAIFPAIGLLLGGAAAGIYIALSSIVSGPVCDLAVVIFFILVTGNMHLDGLMDTADGLGGGGTRERALEIMKDSRVGAHGVIAGCFALLAKFVLLGQLLPEMKIWLLVVLPVLSRWSQVFGAAIYPYARAGGGTGSFSDYVGTVHLLLASAITLVAALFLTGAGGIVLLGAVFSGTVFFNYIVCRRLGGITGDTLGAVTEGVEILLLFVAQFLPLAGPLRF